MLWSDIDIYIPNEAGEAHGAQLVQNAIFSCFALFTQDIQRGLPEFLSAAETTRKSIVIVPATSEKALRAILEQILNLAYGKDMGWYPSDRNNCLYWKRTSYAFLQLPATPESALILLQALHSVCAELEIGDIDHPWAILSLLWRVSSQLPQSAKITSHDLRCTIEEIAFPSGASEIHELIQRDSRKFHDALNYVCGLPQWAKSRPAVRLLLGALAAGDITEQEVYSTLGLPEGSGTDDPIRAFVPARHAVARQAIARLSDYVRGQRYLLIEDNYEEEGWKSVLGTLFGAEPEQVSSPSDALTMPLDNYAFILLDLYSSIAKVKADKTNEVGVNHGIQTISSLPLAVRKFLQRMQKLHTADQPIPQHCPQVIVFSADHSGICVRTMLTSAGCHDYFFKEPVDATHKGQFYCTFKDSVVSAIVRSNARTCGLGGDERGYSAFLKWIRQFATCDRPTVLRIMKHFRYYSSQAIIHILDTFFKSRTQYEGDLPRVIINVFPKPVPTDKSLIFSYLGRLNKSGPATVSIFSKAEWFRDSLRGQEKPSFVTYDDLAKTLLSSWVHNRPAHIIILDDMVLSGGQMEGYLWKFINRCLPDEIFKEIGKLTPKEWLEFAAVINTTATISLCIVSGIGVECRALKETITSDGFAVRICEKLGTHTHRSCDCPNQIEIPIHFADLTAGIEQVWRKERLSEHPESFFDMYSGITTPRENEIPCQFEPLGWKQCGALISTYGNTPANSLSIIWGDKRDMDDNVLWTPLHRRFFNPWNPGDFSGKLPCDQKPLKKCVLMIPCRRL